MSTVDETYHPTPVREFHEAFGHPVRVAPAIPSLEQRLLRVRLLAEELAEFAEACGVSLCIKDWPNGQHSIGVVETWPTKGCDLIAAADALADLRYVVDGGNLVFGFPGERVLAEVHRSNMSKLGADGKPLLREDGKVLKGPNYSPPDIRSVLSLG